MFCFTFGKFNLHELTDVVRFAEENGIETLDFLPLVAFYTDESAPKRKVCTVDNTLENDDPQVLKMLNDAQKLAGELGVQVRIPEFFSAEEKRFSGPICHEPYDLVRVEPDGSVFPCCALSISEPMGNINRQSFENIWLGEKYQKLLAELNRQSESVDLCSNCNHFQGNCLQLGWKVDPTSGQIYW
jgi:radical SAM protein with 4Fe4S-binding SPASM domain